MLSYDDFSSLLQLGVGTGIGLSLFRAPVDIRTSRISKALDGEIGALRGATSDFARRKRRELMTLKVRFTGIGRDLESKQLPFMICAIIGAIANLVGLIFVSFHSDETVPIYWACFLLFISVGFFLFLIAALEVLARSKLSSFQREFTNVQRKAS